MIRKTIITLLFCTLTHWCLGADTFVNFSHGDFALVTDGRPVSIVCHPADDEGVQLAAQSLQTDIKAVCGQQPSLCSEPLRRCIIVGSLRSPLIKQLIDHGKLDGTQLIGKREKYIIQLVSYPTNGVEQALVIAGSDKRGAIYGIYELSRQIGVSPWYWFADIPVEPHTAIFVNKGTYTDGEPKVKFRGIFINDEWPSFGSWCNEQFGGINAKCYARIFELLLRLKANFMWPAMWDSAFYDDDPENGPLANRMGIVMGTSHHEPMALAQQDWKRRKGHGDWSFVRNRNELLDFWREGVRRAKDWETYYTVGLRGDGDEAMEDSGSVRLMEEIVRSQRQLLTEETGRPAEEIPQVWALYKEVQDYYDQGMKVPDDVTLMLCDDNWGNVRRLPPLGAKKRRGGYGMYYHVDYVGAPRNSKWINISPIPRIWEQMNLCYRYGIDQIWILNVGDLKPMEYPIQFFLDMAWNPDDYQPHTLIRHAVDFCAVAFGPTHADEAARLLRTYAKYNRRMAPEHLSSTTYSLNSYQEWQRVTAAYDQLAEDALSLGRKLPANRQDAWFQLLGYPIQACANLYDMYYAQAMNHQLARSADPMANLWADRVAACFRKDSLLCHQYHTMNHGKWNHMMDEKYIGYTSWNSPARKIMPAVVRVSGHADGPLPLPRPTAESYAPATDRKLFAEHDGYISIEAEHYTRKTDGKAAQWTIIPEMGRTLSAITPQPVTSQIGDMVLEYDIDVTSETIANVWLRFSATLNFNVTGLRYGVSFDGQPEQVVNINGHYQGELGQWQQQHVIDSKTTHPLKAGRHTLRFRPLDNGIVLQKILIDLGGHQPCHLWAPETR